MEYKGTYEIVQDTCTCSQDELVKLRCSCEYVLRCPDCKDTRTVYHPYWYASMCQGCHQGYRNAKPDYPPPNADSDDEEIHSNR